ncbi:MAG: T9SS type B sorting domain-containing protein [Bacteroidota bacterium]|nr:T9SS type B sorting domain-containing protein [Bacteroidota bacterium]
MKKSYFYCLFGLFNFLCIYTNATNNPIAIYSPDFSTIYASNWQLNGTSFVINNNVMQLTAEKQYQAGTIFWIGKICNSSDFKFSVFFCFKISSSALNCPTCRADGMTFMIQQNSNAYGGTGGGMGYGGMPGKSIAIEYDTYYNAPNNDPDNNHIAIDINGNVNHLANENYTKCSSLVASASALTKAGVNNLADSKLKYSWIDYDGTYLQVRISNMPNRPTNPVLNIKYNLSSYFNGANVFYGFGAATGARTEQNLIYSAYINNRYTPIDITKNTYAQSSSTTSTTNATICQGQNYSFNGQRYNKTGFYSAVLTNSEGCDSVAKLNLKVIQPDSTTDKEAICKGEKYDFNGGTFNTAGTYTTHLISKEGCDSSATLILTVKEPTSFFLKDTIDQGQTYRWNDKDYYLSGTYTEHLTNAAGCDSTATLNLTVNEIPLSIPKFFTPNGDGYNDTWVIGNINLFPDAEIYVFNRFGKLLTTYKGKDPEWDGRCKGQLMPPDDYWYKIIIKKYGKIYTGHFTLVQ